jgi:hypothetical protein
MRMKLAGLCLVILMGAGLYAAQNAPAPATSQPDYSLVYCSGFVTNQKLPNEMHLISGEQSGEKVMFSQGDYVYINRGSEKGVKVGDEFSVLRPVEEPMKAMWFRGQTQLMRAMGTVYEDEGRIKVVRADAKVSIAQIVFSCAYMQRGDVIRAFQERPAPPYKDPGPFNHFAEPSGKATGTVEHMSDFEQLAGRNHTAYVNLGSAQGVKVGDYLRIFRYQGSTREEVPQYHNLQYEMLGFGSTPVRYTGRDLPREVLGEGIVLNVSANSSTVLITTATMSIVAGDYAEIE